MRLWNDIHPVVWFYIQRHPPHDRTVGTILFGINDLTELFSFSYNLANAFLLGCLASGTTYFISMLVNDFGLKIRLTGDIRNEKK